MSDSTPSIPVSTNASGFLARVNAFLDKSVLPYPVKFLTNRITILATLALLVPLIVFATNQVFVLLANSYLNVMSVVVSSTVLLYSTLAEARDRAAAQRREEIAATHDRMVEQRAETDHKKIQEIHDHIDEIEKLIAGRLDTIQNQHQAHINETHKTVMASIAAHSEELADMRKMLEMIGPNQAQ